MGTNKSAKKSKGGMAKTILVTGATGQQGGAVIDALLAKCPPHPLTLLAVTRDTFSVSAQKLAAKSPMITLVEGNLDDVPTLFESARKLCPAGEPIWGVYSVQVSLGTGVTMESETKQGKALIDGAIKAGVKHFVYSSVERGGDQKSWDNTTPIPHFQSKYQVERYLRENTSSGSVGEGMGWSVPLFSCQSGLLK
jgi:uncharacterized protein YbjT (DUF2867 family)